MPALALTTSARLGHGSKNDDHTARVGERQGRTVTTELDAVDELVNLGLVVEDLLGKSGLGLGEEGNDRDAGVAADDGDGVWMKHGRLSAQYNGLRSCPRPRLTLGSLGGDARDEGNKG